MYASPLRRKSLSLPKFSFLSSKRTFPDWLALPSFIKGRCGIYILEPKGEGEIQAQVMTAVPQQLLIEKKQVTISVQLLCSGSRMLLGTLAFTGSAPHLLEPQNTTCRQAARTGWAAPALSGILRSDDSCRTESFLKPACLSSALFLVWICLLFPAYFLPLTTSLVLLTLCGM